MKRIDVTYSTMGRTSHAHVAEGRPYRYRGDPDWTPNDPRYKEDPTHLGRAAGITEERAKRLKEFGEYLDQGLSAVQAGRLLGVQPSTARHYQRDLKILRARQQGEDG